MKFKDDETISIASTVKDVLEGKAVKKEEEGEVKYPHKMYHPKTGEEVEVKDKAEHDKYNKLGYTHTPKEVAQPKAKGEKDFKSMHDVEVSGEAPDGKVTKAKKGNYYKEEVEEVTITLDEAKKPGRGKEKADIDWIGSNADAKKAEKKFKVKIKLKGRGTADVTGDKKNIVAMLSDEETYGMDMDDIEDLFPELVTCLFQPITSF